MNPDELKWAADMLSARLNIQDACEHRTEHRTWDVNRAVSTTADVCTRCAAKLNQTFSSTMETR